MKKYSSITRASSRRTSQIKKRVQLIIVTGAVLCVILWLIPQVLSFTAAMVATPVQSVKTWLLESSSNFPLYWRDRADLIEENIELREQLALNGGEEHSLKLLQTENETLRSLLGSEESPRILAGIIGRPNNLPYDVLMIDQGSQNGIVQNAPVFIGEDKVIGFVAKVFPNSAVVELVTTPDFVTSVYIIGPDIYTNAVGMGGGQLRVGVPQGIDLSVGNMVILPSVKSGVFGTINHIESVPTRPEQYGYVSTEAPLQSLRYVAVGTVPMEEITFAEAEAIVADAVDQLFEVPVPEGVLVVTHASSTEATSTNEVATSTSEL